MKNNLEKLLEYLLMKEEPEDRHPFEISVDDLVAHRHSLFDAYYNCVYRDRCSRSSGPIVVVPVEDGKYQLIDGYHRLIEHLLDGAKRLLVVIGGEGSGGYAIARGAERWQGDASKRYGNLEAAEGNEKALNRAARDAKKRKKVYKLYHGSKSDFDSFSIPRKLSQRGGGIFFSNSERYAKEFGNIIYKCEIKFNNPKSYDTSLDFTIDEMRSGGVEVLYSKLRSEGYDGIIIKKSKVSTGTIFEAIKFDSDNITILSKTDINKNAKKGDLFENANNGGEDSRWKGLSSLAAEARKAGSYKNFEQDYMVQYKRGLYWHVTMDPDFKIDPTKGPQDKSAGGFGSIGIGDLMFTSDLERWSGHYGKERGYAALLDMTKVPRESYRQVSRGFGNEFYLSDAANSEASVEKVVKISTAKRIDKRYNKLLPKSYEELKEFYEWAIKQ